MDSLWARLGLPPPSASTGSGPAASGIGSIGPFPNCGLRSSGSASESHAQTGRYRRDRFRISDLALAGWEVLEVTPGWTPERIRSNGNGQGGRTATAPRGARRR